MSEILSRMQARWRQTSARMSERLLGLRDFESWTAPLQAALTITSDDGHLNNLVVAEMLAGAGVTGVFAISPSEVGRPDRLDFAQLRRLRDAGHEIAFHGASNEPLTAIGSSQQLLAVTHHGLKQLASEGLDASTLFYPAGANSRAVRATLAPQFAGAFTTWFGLNDGRANRYAIRRIPFGAYTNHLPATEDWYRALLGRAARGACWPVLMLHPGSPSHTGAHNAMLLRIVQHAQDLGLAVRTAISHLDIAAAGSAGLASSASTRSR